MLQRLHYPRNDHGRHRRHRELSPEMQNRANLLISMNIAQVQSNLRVESLVSLLSERMGDQTNHHPLHTSYGAASSHHHHHHSARPGKLSAPPASDKAISRLPHAHITPASRKLFAHDDSECGICCNRLIDGVVLVRLPCGHLYHYQCALRWLTESQCTCPECRYPLPTYDLEYEKGREERMKAYRTVTCSCHPSGYHSCFFNDPGKSLLEQCTSRTAP